MWRRDERLCSALFKMEERIQRNCYPLSLSLSLGGFACSHPDLKDLRLRSCRSDISRASLVYSLIKLSSAGRLRPLSRGLYVRTLKL